jgi:outer membrane protein assembly factor BamB
MRCLAAVLSMLLVPSLLLAQVSAPKQIGASASPINVLTYHNDIGRTGLMPVETILTPANVNSASFGKVNFLPTDGKVGGEPLYASNVMIGGVIHNVLYVVTEHDSIYAFDADTGAQLWKTTALLQGETSTTMNNNCFNGEIGIINTPVIDRTKQPNGAIYFVAMSTDANSVVHQRLHALDLVAGAELFGGPTEIQAKYPGTGDNSQNGFVIFDPKQYAERSGLLELAGNIYLTFTSQCDQRPYTGWVMQYSGSTLQQLSVLDVTPNGSQGAIWQSGAGPAADNDGNIYFLDANGTFDTLLDSRGFPTNGDYGNAMLKLSTSGPLAVADYFNMYNTVQESQADRDLGSGGALVLPDVQVTANKKVHLVIGAGKDKNIYVANRDNMGKWNPNNNNNLYQQLTGALPFGLRSMPAYFHNTVYFGANQDRIYAYPIVSGRLASSPSSQTSNTFAYPGPTPSISANLAHDGILWGVDILTAPQFAVLYAYNALDLTQELYNSNQQGTRDQFGRGNKYMTPMIANGRVYVATLTGVAVFGLLQ